MRTQFSRGSQTRAFVSARVCDPRLSGTRRGTRDKRTMSTPITATMVNELRQRTSRPMMECKKALTQAEGDLAKAEKILRETGHVAKGDRTTGEGRIAVAIDAPKQFGAMVEVLCESAPVAKSELFVD